MSLRMTEPEEHWLGGRRPSMRPPVRIESRVALAVVALLVGFLLAIQATEKQGDRVSRLAAESPEDLTRILADLNAQADELAQQVSSLGVRLARYRTSAEVGDLALRDARKALEDLRVLTGVAEVEGPGLVITISDPERRVEWDALLDLVQELRDAGAEAIAVNGRRVLASTWFGPADAGVTVEGQRAAPPYLVEAIGPAEAMAEALELPGGILTVLSTQPGVSLRLRQEDRLVLPRAAKPASLQLAEPAR
jgi:uncharacterized protein YlxW (UPF0749 family)